VAIHGGFILALITTTIGTERRQWHNAAE